MSKHFVYILTNRSRTIYVGMTNNILRRLYEHKNKVNKGFTAKYNINRLVYFEEVEDRNSALKREKQIKGWLREKKIKLIEEVNPEWKDLSEDVFRKIL